MNHSGTESTQFGIGEAVAAPVRAATGHLRTWYSPRTILLGILVGTSLAVFPLDVVVTIVAPLSLGVLGWTFYRNRSAAAAQLGIIGVILVAAALAPVKAMDEVLQQPIQLPARRMSLAELEAATGSESSFRYDQRWYFSWNLDEVDSAQVVEFSAERIPAGEFIETLETQTPLRHHFIHCGNAYSVLRGSHASHMVLFRKPRSW